MSSIAHGKHGARLTVDGLRSNAVQPRFNGESCGPLLKDVRAEGILWLPVRPKLGVVYDLSALFPGIEPLTKYFATIRSILPETAGPGAAPEYRCRVEFANFYCADEVLTVAQ